MINLHFDLSSFKTVGNHFAKAAKDQPDAMRRAINHTGDKAKTGMKIALVIQTGLKRRTMDKALKSKKASAKGGGLYTITVKGGDARLSKFAARETRKGVSAAPWNARRVYAGSFMKGGQFPNRVALKLHGAVLIRKGKARYPLAGVKSGLVLPLEMLKGGSANAFYTIVERDLPARIAHELARTL